MGRRQLADDQGRRWDVEDNGPISKREDVVDDAHDRYELRFTRDDGTERVREASRPLDKLADIELRSLLEGGSAESVDRGPDTAANRSGGYGRAAD